MKLAIQAFGRVLGVELSAAIYKAEEPDEAVSCTQVHAEPGGSLGQPPFGFTPDIQAGKNG